MTSSPLFDAETLSGLETFAADELRALGAIPSVGRQGSVPFRFEGDVTALSGLRTVTAVYRTLQFDIPRPKALLGHQIFTTLKAAINAIIASGGDFETLSIDAAGAESSVMTRVKTELAAAVNLEVARDKGDLHLRIRKAHNVTAWEVLIRLTPRPLVTRGWRTVNVPGALSAAVSAVMGILSAPDERDTILNLCCGSGSLMVERAALGGYRMLYGLDHDAAVLPIAQQHLGNVGITDARLICGDVTALPFADKSFDVLLADLPFGNLIGTHQDNLNLYPALFDEAARMMRKNARFVLITHEKRLTTTLISQKNWRVDRQVSINLNGLHPEIFVLRRG